MGVAKYLPLRWEIALFVCLTVLIPGALVAETFVAWFHYHWFYAVTTGLALVLIAHVVLLRLLFR